MKMNLRIVVTHACLAGAVLFSGCSAPAGMSGKEPPPSAFDAAEDARPNAKTLYALARILVSQGRTSEAEMTLRRLLREEPGFGPAYALLSDLQVRGGRMAEARETLAGGIKAQPQDAVLLNNAGMCDVLAKDYDAALQHFHAAVQSDAGSRRYRANFAMALAMAGRFDESLNVYETILPAADAHHNVAVLAAMRGDAARAQAEVRAVELASQAAGQQAPTPHPAPASPARESSNN